MPLSTPYQKSAKKKQQITSIVEKKIDRHKQIHTCTCIRIHALASVCVCVCREQCCHVRAFLRLCFVQIAECCTNWNYLLLLCKYNRTHVLAGTTRFGLVLCMLIAADRGDTHITNTHTHTDAHLKLRQLAMLL